MTPRRKKIRIILLIIIPIVLVGMFLLQQYVIGRGKPVAEPPARSAEAGNKGGKGGANRVIPVTVIVAQEQEVADGIRAVGSLVPNEEVVIASEVSGKVTEILFKEGSPVQKGQILVKINDDDLQAQLKRYQFQEKTLKENVERQRILFEKEAISQQSYDEVVTQYNMLLADIELLNVKIDKTRIRAPFSGVVGFRYISDGSYIQPGTQIARLVDYNTLKLEFSIPEKYIGLKLVGKQVTFTTEASKDIHKAVIYAMEPRVEDKTRTIILRARYNNARGLLRPGMSAQQVIVPTSQATQVLMVPTEAIVPSLDGKSIWIAKEGQAELIPVETGSRTETQVEVLKGIVPGDSVIVTGLMQLRDGAKIKVTN